MEYVYTTQHVEIPQVTQNDDSIPQLVFESMIDNSDTPFIPPHAVEHFPISGPHPMEDKIFEALEIASILLVTQPIAFYELDDDYPFEWIATK